MCENRVLQWLSWVTLLLALAGCGPEYHVYPCGCVPYGYCPPAPLPYTTYCACPTPMAAQFQPSPELATPPEPTPPTPGVSGGDAASDAETPAVRADG